MDHIDADSFHLVGQDEFAKMKSAGSYFQEGDVLYGRLRPYLNKVHRAKFEGVASAEFIVLPASDFFDGEFIKYLLHRKKFVDFAMSRSSGDRPRVKFDGIAEFEFPLPPLNEQRRIVEKIETLFARLDQGEAALRHTQTLLARYRQSVLKAAVTGALTADWRAANAHRLEHGRDLLARILQTRRETWQGRGKYQEPAAPDTSNLPELPEGWVWASVEQLGEVNRKIAYGVLQPGKQFDGGIKLVRVGDVNGGEVHLGALKEVDPAIAAKYPRTNLQGNEVLVTLVGTIGRSAVVPPEIAGANVARAVGVVPVLRDFVNSHWLAHCFNSPANSQKLIGLAHEVARKTLNLEDVRRFQVPLPSLEEQNKIVERLSVEISKVIAAESQCGTELTRSAALRQSVLKDAFAGKLVPQDPSDEPAAELLARIRASRPAPARKKARA